MNGERVVQPQGTLPEQGHLITDAAATMSGDIVDRTGATVAGFRVARLVSEDPRALVYRAERGSEGGYLRVLRRSLSQDRATAARFIESAKLLRRMRFPGLAKVVECGTLPDGCCYVLVQARAGELLSERIRRNASLAPLAPALGPIAKGLAMLHAQGLVYLGIEPGRIQVLDGTSPALELLDSEHARSVAMQLPAPEIAARQVQRGVDPVLFMAPEIFGVQAEVGTPADVYALGVLAYDVLSGRLPLEAETTQALGDAHPTHAPAPLRRLVPRIPAELASLVEAMLDRDPKRRPSMEAVATRWPPLVEALRSAPEPPPPVVVPPPPVEPPVVHNRPPTGSQKLDAPRREPPVVAPPHHTPPAPGPEEQRAVPGQSKTEGYATAALIAGIVGLVIPFVGVLAIIFGSSARQRIADSRGALTGEGMATAGLVLGILNCLGSVLWFTC